MGVNNLVRIFDPKYYTHLSGGILEAFGKLFFKNMRIYLYPMLNEKDEIINSDNLKVHPRMKELYKFLKFNGKVVDLNNYNLKSLKIYSHEVLNQIKENSKGWETLLPKAVAAKSKNLIFSDTINNRYPNIWDECSFVFTFSIICEIFPFSSITKVFLIMPMYSLPYIFFVPHTP